MILPLLCTVLLQAAPEPAVRRYAVVVGANDGGKARVTLRYAASDAKAVAGVLGELGGIQRGDLVSVEEPTPEQLRRVLDELESKLTKDRATASRLELVFYYSGHSDETALRLGEATFPYDELRRRLESMPADVRVAIVDACASGALTRAKGGVSRAPFLVDASTQLKGHAFLTSASVDEAAQESDRLKASVFTHALLSGLRGGADASRDGRVTLNEAYQFAFNETLARTASTLNPQRPNFDIQLVGSGEMVLTDVRAASAQLELGAAVGGRVFVLSGTGALVVELAKTKGSPMQLGVEPGSYRVLVDDSGKLGELKVALAERQTVTVEPGQLTTVTKDALVTRGDRPTRSLPVDVAFVYPLSIGGALGEPPHTFFSLGILTAREGEVTGAAVSTVGAWIDGPTTGVAIGGVGFRTGGLTGLGAAGAVFVSTEAATGLVVAPVTIVSSRVSGAEVGAANVATAGLFGAQVGAANVAIGDSVALQAGAANVTLGHFSGLQGSAANVVGGNVVGAQVGLLNIGGDVVGAQLGVVNIAGTVRGAQLGLVNVAKDASAPIGLVNVMREGRFRASVWGGEASVVNAALKLGTRRVYSHVVAGWNPRGTHLSYGLGLGLHVDVGRFYGQLEADVLTVSTASRLTTKGLQTTQRFVVGYQVIEAFSVYAGPSFSQLVPIGGADLSPVAPWAFAAGDVRLVPEFVVGVQLF